MFGLTEKMKTFVTLVARAVWCPRVLYAGLAGAYLGLCFGVEKELVQQIIAGCYVALVVKG